MKKLLLLLTAVVATIGTGTTSATAAPNTPRKAPELAFTVPGQGQKLLSQYRGKVVALEFVFTTCPHCQAASKVMTKFQQEYGSRGLQCLDVAMNDNADLLVENFAKDFQVGFPVGWTTRDQMLAFMGFSTVERFVVPQIILIDRQGVIHYQTPPMGDENSMKEDTIQQRIEELLGSRSTSVHPTAKTGAKLQAASRHAS